MGLFSKKPKEPEYDAVDCERKKKRICHAAKHWYDREAAKAYALL